MENSNRCQNRRNLLLALAFILVPIMWMAPSFVVLGRQTHKMNSSCEANMQRIGKALQTYADAHDGHLPPAQNWAGELLPIVDGAEVFRCPADKTEGRSSYALNANLAGRKLSEISPEIVLLYEVENSGENPAGGGDDVMTLGQKALVTGNRLLGGRHNAIGHRFNYYLFADGTLHHPTYLDDLQKYGW